MFMFLFVVIVDDLLAAGAAATLLVRHLTSRLVHQSPLLLPLTSLCPFVLFVWCLRVIDEQVRELLVWGSQMEATFGNDAFAALVQGICATGGRRGRWRRRR